MHKYLTALLFLLSTNVLASDYFDTYYGDLYLDAVNVDGIKYYNVVIYDVRYSDVTYSGYSYVPYFRAKPHTTRIAKPHAPMHDACLPFTITQYNAITVGMTMNQVEQLLGCFYTPSKITADANATYIVWESTSTGLERIVLTFDTGYRVVTPPAGTNAEQGFWHMKSGF